MSLSHGSSIIRDGLVLHLDAANVKSYPGTGTVWKDLNGNGNDGTVVGGVEYLTSLLGTMLFGGTGYIDLGQFFASQQTWTVSSFFMTENINTRGEIVGEYPESGSYRSIIGHNSSGEFHSLMGGSETKISYALQQNVWYYGSARYNHTTNDYILNLMSNEVDESVVTSRAAENNHMSRIGTYGGNGEWEGEIALVQIHNKFLTDNEVKQNFEAQRSRFNI